MKEEIYEHGEIIIEPKVDYKKIFFIASGQVEIVIHNHKYQCCLLDVLKQGDHLG